MANATTTNCPHCGADHSEWIQQSEEKNGIPAIHVCACDARIYTEGGEIVDSVDGPTYHDAQADFESQMGDFGEWGF